MVEAKIRLAVACAVILTSCAQEEPKKYGTRRAPADKTQETAAGPCLVANSNVIGGREIPDTQHPYVAKLEGDGLCTGTFIAPNVFITAAHCTSDMGQNKNPSPSTFTINGKNPLKIIHHPRNPMVFQDLENNDLSILVMPTNASASYAPILNRQPQVSEAIIVVGFGVTANGAGAGVKREGTNKLASLDGDGKLIIQQSGGAIGASGDSGGPLFIEGKLAGTTVGGGGGSEFYTNLWSTENMTFLRDTATAEGLKICGLDGLDCGKSEPSSGPQPPTPTVPNTTDCFMMRLEEH